MTKTYQPTQKEVKREWHLFDAKDAVLGRLATKIAMLLMGKTKATYSAHMDSGDYVVVTNVEKVKLTGNKENQKVYYGHSGYPGGLKKDTVTKVRKDNPARILEHAVTGMLPNNRLRDDRMNRLKLIVGEQNPYAEKFKTQKSNIKSTNKN